MYKYNGEVLLSVLIGYGCKYYSTAFIYNNELKKQLIGRMFHEASRNKIDLYLIKNYKPISTIFTFLYILERT